MFNKTELVKRKTLAAMVQAYNDSVADIREGYRLLDQAKERLVSAFDDGNGYCFDTNPRSIDHCYGGNTWTDRVLNKIKCAAWRKLMGKMNLKKYLSSKRARELDAQLEKPSELPVIDTDTIIGMIENASSNLDDYIVEAVVEVFDMLRPRRGWDDYKTNDVFQVGPKVILTAFYPNQWGNKPHIDHGREQDFRNLDNVFHLLDGKGPVSSHYGPLVDATRGAEVEFGEWHKTVYFEFKIFKNGNIHIKFRRLDLVEELNRRGGEGRKELRK